MNFTPSSVNSGYPRVTAAFSILGTSKEDELLAYARDNHITYLELYDLYRVFRYNDTVGTILPSGLSLIEGLCSFMEKAKSQYCITEIGAAGGTEEIFDLFDQANQSGSWTSPPLNLTLAESQFLGSQSTLFNYLTTQYSSSDSLFRISEQLKHIVRLFRLNGTCTSHFDFYNISFEYWSGVPGYTTAAYYDEFVPLVGFVDTLKQLYNAIHNTAHTDSVRVAVYIRAINSPNVDPTFNARDDSSVYLLDGRDTIPPTADRIIAVHYEQSPTMQYTEVKWQSQMNLFKRPLTRGKTDYHPLFSTETYIMNHYTDYALGPWLRDRYQNNIFEAETEFYRRWRADPNTVINSPHENDIQPGGFHYFASSFMIDSLDSPRIFSTNSPICTGGLVGDSLRIIYMGPREDSIFYTLTINDNGTLRTFTGFTGEGDSLLDNLNFNPAYLDTLHNPYPISLTLEYNSGCSYTFRDTVYVRPRPFIQATGPITFCQGYGVILTASQGSAYSWRKNSNSSQELSNQQFLRVDTTGTYYCIISGGGCSGNSNQISVNVQPNPVRSIYVSCLGSINRQLSVIPVPATGSTYQWSTNETTQTITDNTPGGNNFYVIVKTPEGCQQTGYAVIHTPNHIPHPEIISAQSAYCNGDPNVTSITLSPQDYVVGSPFYWTINGQKVKTDGDLTIPAFAENTTIFLEQVSASGCSNIGYDTINISVFNCCNNPNFTQFITDSSSHYPTGWYGESINLRGNFIVNKDFTISGSTLNIDSSAYIYIMPGKTLNIRSSTLSACTSKWKGIILFDPTARVQVDSNSVIQDAVTGINASGGAIVKVRNSTFSNNNRCIYLHDGNFQYSIMDGVTFNGSQTLQLNYGIDLIKATGVSIGNSALGMNYFDNLRIGINSDQSDLNVQRCTFQPNSAASRGISSFGGNGSTYQLNIGGSAGDACYFNDCEIGVFSNGNNELHITFNQFNNINYMSQTSSYGIQDFGAFGVSVEVNNNQFDRLDFGISLRNRFNAGLTIKDNKFNNFYPVPVRQGSRAISVWNTQPASVSIHKQITGNTIKHYQRGISLISQRKTTVADNVILFDAVNPQSIWYGIRIQDGDNNFVERNNINRTVPYPDLGLSNAIFGITVEKSSDNQISDNDVANLGAGIRFFTTLLNAVRCNEMIFNVDNLVIEESLIGDQGGPNDASDNIWTINPNTVHTNANYGNILNVGSFPSQIPTFYVQNQVGYNPAYAQAQVCPFICPYFAAQITPSTSSNRCYSTKCTDADCYQEMIDRMIKEQDEFANLPDEQAAQVREYAFKLLVRDSMLMYQSTVLDAELRDFYFQMKLGNSGLFDEIVILLQQEENLGAIIVNSTLTPENLSESNQKLFNEIYLSSWAENNFELDINQQATLEFIAYQNPYFGGNAVYSARIMLGLDIADFIENWMERQSKIEGEYTLNDKGIIVPNPNTGKMSYIYSSGENEMSEMQIFNSRGGLVRKYYIFPETQSIDIDLSDQLSGIYIYKIIMNGNMYLGNKIILQK